MSNKQRYRLNRLASILVTPERFQPDFKFPFGSSSNFAPADLIAFNRYVAKCRAHVERTRAEGRRLEI